MRSRPRRWAIARISDTSAYVTADASPKAAATSSAVPRPIHERRQAARHARAGRRCGRAHGSAPAPARPGRGPAAAGGRCRRRRRWPTARVLDDGIERGARHDGEPVGDLVDRRAGRAAAETLDDGGGETHRSSLPARAGAVDGGGIRIRFGDGPARPTSQQRAEEGAGLGARRATRAPRPAAARRDGFPKQARKVGPVLDRPPGRPARSRRRLGPAGRAARADRGAGGALRAAARRPDDAAGRPAVAAGVGRDRPLPGQRRPAAAARRRRYQRRRTGRAAGAGGQPRDAAEGARPDRGGPPARARAHA